MTLKNGYLQKRENNHRKKMIFQNNHICSMKSHGGQDVRMFDLQGRGTVPSSLKKINDRPVISRPDPDACPLISLNPFPCKCFPPDIIFQIFTYYSKGHPVLTEIPCVSPNINSTIWVISSPIFYASSLICKCRR